MMVSKSWGAAENRRDFQAAAVRSRGSDKSSLSKAFVERTLSFCAARIDRSWKPIQVPQSGVYVPLSFAVLTKLKIALAVLT